MKFKEWEDFADQINEYGRYGYVKKQSSYNPFTKINVMIMEHQARGDEEIFVLYPDDESYDLDWENEPYVREPSRAEKFLEEMPKRYFDPKIDRRTREHRSKSYPDKPGTKKEDIQKQNPTPVSDKTPPPRPKPGPPRSRKENPQ